jgi:hypothetical protein
MVDEVTYNADSASWTSDIIALEQFSASLVSNFATVTQLNQSSSTLQNNINTKLNTSSFNAYTASQETISASFNTRINSVTGSATNTGSLLLTASAVSNVITFTKGDGSTFPVTIATGSSTSTDTGSLLLTASVAGNVITFTKGNGSTFPITVATGSGGVSGDFVTTSSFNSYTASAASGVSASINAATSSLSSSLSSSIGSLSASLTLTDNSKLNSASFNTYTSSNDSKVNELINKTGSYATTGSNTFVGNQIVSGNLNISGSVTVINALTASKLEVNGVTDLNGVLDVSNDATFRGDVLIQSSGEQKFKMRSTSGGGVSQGFDLLIQTSSFIIRDETHNIDFFEFDYNSGSTDHTLKLEANRFELNSGSLGVSGSFTASLAEGYVWVGGVGNVSTAISTASLVVSVNTGSFATTGSNTFIGNQIISGNLLVTGSNINLEVDPPALGGIGTTNVKTVLDTTASAIVTSLDLTRQAAGPTGDLTAIRLQTFSGSSDTTGDRLLSRITTGVNRHTSLGLSGSVVNTQVNAVWATGSSAFTSQIVETAQSGSATLGINVGNLASNNAGGTASISAGLIRIGGNASHTISVTGSVGPISIVGALTASVISASTYIGIPTINTSSFATLGANRFIGNQTITGSLNVSASLGGDDGNLIRGGVTIVGDNNGNAISVASGSVAITSPQGTGFFYSNLPITSSKLRINGTGIVKDLIISGTWGGDGSGSLSVENNITLSGSMSISGSGIITLTGSYAGNPGFSGSVITNVGDTYTSTAQARNIVTLDSASMATLLSGGGTNANTLYFVI